MIRACGLREGSSPNHETPGDWRVSFYLHTGSGVDATTITSPNGGARHIKAELRDARTHKGALVRIKSTDPDWYLMPDPARKSPCKGWLIFTLEW
jgi:hypothetical protein